VSGEHDEVDDALTYLEADVYEFRSGYERARVARRLSHSSMDAAQRARARRYVLDVVEGRKHCTQPALGRLAHAVADNPTRAALRARLLSTDTEVARRAMRTLSFVRHPSLNEDERERARGLVLADAGRTSWVTPSVRRLARWLWAPEWEAALRELARHHGPDRAAAKKLIEDRDRRREHRARRPSP